MLEAWNSTILSTRYCVTGWACSRRNLPASISRNKPASSSRDETQWRIAGRARCRHLDAADFKAGHAYSERSEGSIAFPFRILLFFMHDACFRGWQHDSIPGRRRRLARLLGSSSIIRSFDRVALTATQFRSEGIQNIAGAF